MTFHAVFLWTLTLGPALCMGLACSGATLGNLRIRTQWQIFITLSGSALLLAILSWIAGPHTLVNDAVIQHTRIGLILAVLVQLLGTVIGVFSFRYLEGEPGQSKYIVALAGVLASVQILLMAQHWIVLIAAWSLTGFALHQLLCFYPDRPFARLAAHKKRMADRLADILLILAASLAWSTTGSGSFSSLETHITTYGMSLSLQIGAVALVLAVILRTALLMHAVPLHLPAHPHEALGIVALVTMTMLYLSLVGIQRAPEKLANWHRWSYAGFYMDEAYTRLALKIWPTQWVPASTAPSHSPVIASVLAHKTQ